MALTVHIIVLGALYINNPLEKGQTLNFDLEESPDLEMDFVSMDDAQKLEEEFDKLPSHLEEQIRNLVANQESQKTYESVSYSKQSNESLEREIMDRLKAIEDGVKEEIHKNDDPNSVDNNSKDVIDSHEKSDLIWNDQEKSYAGKVMVSYKLSKREQRYLPIPGYKCKISGMVTVNVEVNKNGEVSSFSINEVQTTTSSECLRTEAVAYAKQSVFNSTLNANKKQKGTITYLFSAQ